LKQLKPFLYHILEEIEEEIDKEKESNEIPL
jgi:hypothetical protein